MEGAVDESGAVPLTTEFDPTAKAAEPGTGAATAAAAAPTRFTAIVASWDALIAAAELDTGCGRTWRKETGGCLTLLLFGGVGSKGPKLSVPVARAVSTPTGI
jgi:hypothetical protein